MLLAKTDEPLVNYAGDENLLIIPITLFVRKDGNVALIDEDAKLVAEAYPDMTRYFGYMVEQGVIYPVFRQKGINVMGVPDRTHYASSPDQDLIAGAMPMIAQAAHEYADMLLYLFPFGGDEDANRDMFADVKNLVLLIKDE